jgi:hypothetical protein
MFESHRSGLNRRPPDYESGALPLSYCGKGAKSPSLPSALERTRTAMPFGTTPSRWRVYQFHHQGTTKIAVRSRCDRRKRSHLLRPAYFQNTGPTGLEPATSRVTVECSNQTELRPQLLKSGSETPSSPRTCLETGLVVNQSAPIAPRGIEPLSAP